MTDEQGKIDGTEAVSLQRALAALNATQQRLASSDTRYRAIVENAVDAIITIDECGLIESINPSAVRMFEYSKEELIGRNVSMLVPSPDREKHDDYIRQYLKTGKARIIGIGRDVEGVRKSGERFPMRLSIGESELDGRHFFTGIIQDLTDRRRYDESVQLISAIVESSNDAIIGLTLDGTLSSWNGGAERLCGYTASEMIGRPFSTIIPIDQRICVTEARARVERGESVMGSEMSWLRRDGAAVSVIVNLSPIRDADGDVVGASVVAHDTTPKKKAERDLEDINRRLMIAIDQAQSASEAKTQFVANMSHEIRTPMTAILGYISVLSEKIREPDGDVGEALDSICRNGHQLLQLIDDILDFAKLEAGKLEQEFSRFSPMELVEGVLAPMRERASKKGLVLQLKCQEEIPSTIETDASRLRQILENLIDNALKFTEVGHVTLTLRRVVEAGESFLEFAVADSGIGIDPARVGELFEPFSQADTSMSRRFGGTGLGLSVCARLVKLLGGEIRASGLVGQGSEFSFTIPMRSSINPTTGRQTDAKTSESTLASDGGTDRLEGCHVLLVEDGIDNQRLYRRLLVNAGACVEVVSNGAEAVDQLVSRRERNALPDIVLMDMQMPVMDGYLATRTLRDKEFTLPIIALTAHAMSNDRARCIGVGCDDYLSKPVDRKLLVSRIRQWLGPQEPSPAQHVHI
ncbi:MAG: PAS domain S-box protein [Phycisphaerales bacterium]|nr:PAS domain S-box protein [Phycisphaerales bacterium]MCB9864880.1 PAS domain S-box protein [Phycisphaerales bacterium]